MASQVAGCVACGLHNCFRERQLLELQLLGCMATEHFGLVSRALLKPCKCLCKRDSLAAINSLNTREEVFWRHRESLVPRFLRLCSLTALDTGRL